MKACIVVGLGFGDEGKGLVTNWLWNQPNTHFTVIRYAGGPQCGHNVVAGNGVSHIHSNYCSAAIMGGDSYFSEHCSFYPVTARREKDVLNDKHGNPNLILHPLVKVITPYDIAFGRIKEQVNKHGSCGLGIGACMTRNDKTPHKLIALDMFHLRTMEVKLEEIRKFYLQQPIMGSLSAKRLFLEIAEEEMSTFYSSIEQLKDEDYLDVRTYNALFWGDTIAAESIVFEGAQGIMLDAEHGLFPNVTYGNTTTRNAMEICKKLKLKKEDISIYYVTRCYQTRHGNGWMSNETAIPLINNEKETNVDNEFQGKFRIGEFDPDLIVQAFRYNSLYSEGVSNNHLVVTCMDQRPDWKLPEEVAMLFDVENIHASRSPISVNIEKMNLLTL